MQLCKNLLIAGAALAIAALPLKLELGSLDHSSAFAKNGGGGGNGNGGGSGNRGGGGGGNGKSGDHGNSGNAGSPGKSASAGSHGKSAIAGSHAKSGSFGLKARGRSKTMFSHDTQGTKGNAKSKKPAEARFAKADRKSARAFELAALPETAPIPEVKVKEKNLTARLAGLNSLKRNYHAYLNSNAPRMASIRAFVMASANLDIANEELSAAQTEFDQALDEAALTPYDGAVGVYDDPTLAVLEARLAELENATVAPEDLDAWEAEKTALESLLDSEEAKDLAEAEDAAELAAIGTDDEALKQALLDAANKNRVAQYGDDYINDDVMNWAKSLLGVGDEVGKIDEVRDTLLIDSQ